MSLGLPQMESDCAKRRPAAAYDTAGNVGKASRFASWKLSKAGRFACIMPRVPGRRFALSLRREERRRRDRDAERTPARLP
jgi:hypothetical protein